jgi:sugar (pentulose or hexulose) kinase
MDRKQAAAAIQNGSTALGIEFGSTRIKAVLIGPDHAPLAQGDHTWENSLADGIWTYSLEEVWSGLQEAYRSLAADVARQYGATLQTVGCIGFSAMMHGYLVFDKEGRQLVPFRTWRNTITGPAAEKLTRLFRCNIPQRWSIAHLYQAMLNGEEHVSRVAFLTTLAGYVHWKMTGRKVLGIGDASGMFPIDSAKGDYDAARIAQFDALAADAHFSWNLRGILPQVLCAGEDAGTLTAEGAKLLDPTGTLKPGIPLCPPEGDAGTGMAATNSVAPRTGNVSAGTSIFSMVVLEKPLHEVYTEIDLVATPSGAPVAMVHCNNCTSEMNAWVSLFREFAGLTGTKVDTGALFTMLYKKSLEGDADCGGLMLYNYGAGEGVTHFDSGRPLFVRKPDANFTLANLMRVHLYSALATLKIGMDILAEERVAIDCLTGHGGLFKTPGVGQRYLAAAVNAPVTCMETAGEGGAWGAALLAMFRREKTGDETLAQYLSEHVFADMKRVTLAPDASDCAGFEAFMKTYRAGLAVESAAVSAI